MPSNLDFIIEVGDSRSDALLISGSLTKACLQRGKEVKLKAKS